MWTRESLEAAVAKRARTLPGLTPGTVYIGPADPNAVAGKDSYVAIVFGGGPFGRPALRKLAPRYSRYIDEAVAKFIRKRGF